MDKIGICFIGKIKEVCIYIVGDCIMRHKISYTNNINNSINNTKGSTSILIYCLLYTTCEDQSPYLKIASKSLEIDLCLWDVFVKVQS
jgi:hypothetical protein